MQKPSIKFVSLGCSKNLVDSEVLMGQVEAGGLRVLGEEEPNGDIVVINTCGFINDAKEESIETILDYVKAKEDGRVSKVVVMGCLSERYTDQIKKEIPEIDNLYGVNDIPAIVEELGARYREELIGERHLTTPSHFAYLKISEGCDRSCAFCAIPNIRGGHRSRSIDSLLDEARALSAKGVKELILIAQDLTYYGKDLYGRQALAELLEGLVQIDGIQWIRLHYAYPVSFPLEVLDLMRREEKICNYIDIPLQHASDRILKRMRRGHHGRMNRELLQKFRDKVPGLTVRSTFIVGFPGETDEDFEALKAFIRESEFDRVGVFTYSHEEDTHAYAFEDDVPAEVKQQRADELMALQEEISFAKNQAKVGRVLRVLIDRKEGDEWYGRTEADSYEVDNEVIIKSDEALQCGEFYPIMITDAGSYELYGRPNKHAEA